MLERPVNVLTALIDGWMISSNKKLPCICEVDFELKSSLTWILFFIRFKKKDNINVYDVNNELLLV